MSAADNLGVVRLEVFKEGDVEMAFLVLDAEHFRWLNEEFSAMNVERRGVEMPHEPGEELQQGTTLMLRREDGHEAIFARYGIACSWLSILEESMFNSMFGAPLACDILS